MDLRPVEATARRSAPGRDPGCSDATLLGPRRRPADIDRPAVIEVRRAPPHSGGRAGPTISSMYAETTASVMSRVR
jgi:hypothetical protein